MKPGAQSLRFSSVGSALGAKTRRASARLGFRSIKLPKGTDLTAAIESIRKDPSVEYVGVNHVLHVADVPQVMPDDPLFRQGYDPFANDPDFAGMFLTQPQWGLYNDGDNNGKGGKLRADIHAPEAWAITTGSPSVIIASLDTGVDYTHPDMADKIWTNSREIPDNGIDDDGNGYVDDWRGWDFVNHDNDPMDDHEEQGMHVLHGTFTAGIAAAGSDNGIGVAGVAWRCPIMICKVIGADGSGLEDDCALAVQYAVDMGAKVINMSLAGSDAPLLHQAVDYAWQKGCLCVCASGNEGVTTPSYPASYSTALAVGASNEYDQRCTASDWGQGGSNYGDYLDIVAPGNNILSCTSILDFIDPDNPYYILPGTSAATPFVSGAAALVWSLHPDWTNAQVMYQLLATADDIGAAGWDAETGWGRLNAYRALTETLASSSTTASVKSAVSGARVLLRGKVLSTGSSDIPNRLYVQEVDRSSGILLSFPNGAPSGFAQGNSVDVFGTAGDVNGERALINPIITKVSSGNPPVPMALSTRALGGGKIGLQGAVVDRRFPSPSQMASGLNNIGILVTISGKVTQVSFDWCYLDDGSGLSDGSGNTGVYVYTGALDRPEKDHYAVITGISSCEYMPGGSTIRYRVLRPRTQADIVTVQ